VSAPLVTAHALQGSFRATQTCVASPAVAATLQEIQRAILEFQEVARDLTLVKSNFPIFV
jgi:hypothetical protein